LCFCETNRFKSIQQNWHTFRENDSKCDLRRRRVTKFTENGIEGSKQCGLTGCKSQPRDLPAQKFWPRYSNVVYKSRGEVNGVLYIILWDKLVITVWCIGACRLITSIVHWMCRNLCSCTSINYTRVLVNTYINIFMIYIIILRAGLDDWHSTSACYVDDWGSIFDGGVVIKVMDLGLSDSVLQLWAES